MQHNDNPLCWELLENHKQFGFCELDKEYRIYRCTDSFAKMLNSSKIDLLALYFLDLIEDADQEFVLSQLRTVCESGPLRHSFCIQLKTGDSITDCLVDLICMDSNDENNPLFIACVVLPPCKDKGSEGDQDEIVFLRECLSRLQQELTGVYEKLFTLSVEFARNPHDIIVKNENIQQSSDGTGAINQTGENDVRQKL